MLRFSLFLTSLCLIGTGCTVNEVIVADETELIVADAAVYGVNPDMVLVGFGFYIIRLYIGVSLGPPSIGLD